MNTRRTRLLAICLILLLSAPGCASASGSDTAYVKREAFYFDTFVTIGVYHADAEEILDGCMALCGRMEGIFDRTDEKSELYRINHRDGDAVTLSEDMRAVIGCALDFYDYTDGKLDLTVAPLVDVWQDAKTDGRLPDADVLAAAVRRVGADGLRLSGNVLYFDRPDISIDLGAFAKGYISDRLKDYLIDAGVKHALINLGGNVCALGDNRGTPWRVGIQDPSEKTGVYKQVVTLTDKAVICAGTYERYVTVSGRRYHHILDPDTGYPADTSHALSSVIADDGLTGDALSTAALLMEDEAALTLARRFDAKLMFCD